MKRGKRLSSVLMIAVMCILIIYAGMWIGEKKDWEIRSGITLQMNRKIFTYAEENYLTGLSFVGREHELSADVWLSEQVMRMFPLGTYVQGRENIEVEIEDSETYEMILAKQAGDENAVDENGNLIGDGAEETVTETTGSLTDISLEKLKNYEYLLSTFYTVDSTTMTNENEINAEKLLGKDMTLQDTSGGPKVLIYHTHSQEAFADSVAGDAGTTIMGMGSYLTELLNAEGIPAMHHEGVYDLIGGKLDRSKAYQLAEPEVQKILSDNPSIEVVIDLHRDGVAKTTHLVTEIDGKPVAQIMFFNGLSRTKANGDIAYLANPYIEDNLAFSLQMQLKATEMYPGFTRRIYLKGYRYNMHLKPKTLLIEAGAQTNTVEEMRNAMEYLSKTLDSVLKP